MNLKSTFWTKVEFQTYLLLFCANADSIETEEELRLIKSKSNTEIFDKMYQEFCNDNEDERFEKIEECIHNHEYSYLELATLKKDIKEIFFSDKNYVMMEKNMNRILDNILY